jgi:hypothetical protein
VHRHPRPTTNQNAAFDQAVLLVGSTSLLKLPGVDVSVKGPQSPQSAHIIHSEYRKKGQPFYS